MSEREIGRGAIEDSSTDVLDRVLQLIEEKYVFVDVAECAVASIRQRMSAGVYDEMSDPTSFAQAVTVDLQAATSDAHLRLVYDPDRIAKMRSRKPGRGIADIAKLHNNGFARVENLKGGVGYVDIRHFFAPSIAAETAAAAMQFVAGSDAVIVDLRHNTGGNPSMVQFLCSYFFPSEPRVHLNTITSRLEGTSTEYWTLEDLPGPRMAETVLYVLTSGHTFSGGEEFAYNISSLERGTIVGETTAGGANPAGIDILDDEFYLTVPHATPTNPVTGANWEGCGVAPHVETSADLALEAAHRMALEGMIARETDEIARTKLDWCLEEAMSAYHPLALSPAALETYAGKYGDTEVRQEGDSLTLRRKFFTFRLVPLSETRFWLDGPSAGFEPRVEFVRDDSGQLAKMVSSHPDGRRLSHSRNP